jgi:hypothetical protein
MNLLMVYLLNDNFGFNYFVQSFSADVLYIYTLERWEEQ